VPAFAGTFAVLRRRPGFFAAQSLAFFPTGSLFLGFPLRFALGDLPLSLLLGFFLGSFLLRLFLSLLLGYFLFRFLFSFLLRLSFGDFLFRFFLGLLFRYFLFRFLLRLFLGDLSLSRTSLRCFLLCCFTLRRSFALSRFLSGLLLSSHQYFSVSGTRG
jgi:hypothetical protein